MGLRDGRLLSLLRWAGRSDFRVEVRRRSGLFGLEERHLIGRAKLLGERKRVLPGAARGRGSVRETDATKWRVSSFRQRRALFRQGMCQIYIGTLRLHSWAVSVQPPRSFLRLPGGPIRVMLSEVCSSSGKETKTAVISSGTSSVQAVHPLPNSLLAEGRDSGEDLHEGRGQGVRKRAKESKGAPCPREARATLLKVGSRVSSGEGRRGQGEEEKTYLHRC